MRRRLQVHGPHKPRGPLPRHVRMMDVRLSAVLASGMLASTVLLAASSAPPSISVSELWALGEDASVTVYGLVVSLWVHDSGAETLVLSDDGGGATVRVLSSQGTGPAPSSYASIGDLVEVRGECGFEGETPTVYCEFGGVRVLAPSEEALTVAALSASWRLFEGDRFRIAGLCDQVGGAPRLCDESGPASIAMRLDDGVAFTEGRVVADCTLSMDPSLMALFLAVHRLQPSP